MSLVHQALRKAEQEKHRKTGAIPRATAAVVAPAAAVVPVAAPAAGFAAAGTPQPRPVESRRRAWLPAGLGCVVFFAVVAGVLLLTRERPSAAAAASGNTAAPPTQPAVVTEPRSALPPAPTAAVGGLDDSRYQLTGIAQEPDGRPVAVINGQPRYENQYIDGATVKKIERDRVTLDVQGQSIVKRLY